MIEFLPRLRRFAYSLTGNMDLGDDLVQETCLRALSRLEQWKPGTKLESWMFRIAQNIWLDRARANKVRGEFSSLDVVESAPGADGRDVVEGRMALEAVNRGIATLPAEQQVLIGLICIDGASYKEASEILEIPMGTVMSRLARARKTLHEYIEGDDAVSGSSSKEEGHGRVP